MFLKNRPAKITQKNDQKKNDITAWFTSQNACVTLQNWFIEKGRCPSISI